MLVICLIISEISQFGVRVSRQGAYFVLPWIMYKAFEFGICLEDRTSMRRIMTGESWSGFKGRGQEAGMRYNAVHFISLHCIALCDQQGRC